MPGLEHRPDYIEIKYYRPEAGSAEMGKTNWEMGLELRSLVNGTTWVQCLRNNTSSKLQEELAGTGQVAEHY